MKIRNGFVSNSSSSSFCIYGAVIEDVGVFKKVFEGVEGVDFDDIGLSDISELMEGYGDNKELTKRLRLPEGFEVHQPEGYDGMYIGRSWDSVGDNETGKEFKKDVEDKLKKLIGQKIDCDTHAESWYS